jgi:hypothetical protein
MLVALGILASAQTKGTKATAKAITHLLNYCAMHPDAPIRYHASDMTLKIHSDGSYLSESEAQSHAGGHFFLSNTTSNPSKSSSTHEPLPPNNGAIHTLCSIMKMVHSSAAEAETAALFTTQKMAPCYGRPSMTWAIHKPPHQSKPTILVLQ